MVLEVYRNYALLGSKQLDKRELAHYCLNLAGGGYSERQTAQAMHYLDQLMNSGTVEVKSLKLKLKKQ